MVNLRDINYAENNKVSIVIPIYNTEKYLNKCLDSIISQSYKNLEIICVNDASPDNSLKIVNEYTQIDERIKVVSYDKNRGLFHARLAGAEIATGDYICFVDSDDTISVDWIRLLVKKAQDENADMVLANTVQIDKQGYFIENNYMSLCFNRPSLIGDEIFDTFMKDEGLNFAWHTVWNKLYSMELWKNSIPDFEPIKNHLIMAEDIAYSLVLYYHSKKMAFSNHDAYFYYRHDEASTSATISLDRVKKNIEDISRVFKFFENFLRKYNLLEKYKKEFSEYKARNFRIYCNILYYRNLWDNKKFENLLLNGFGYDKLELTHSDDFYFYDIRTPWEGNIGYNEKLKKLICDKKYKIISFDLFDTLAMRPFSVPSHLFTFMETKYADFFELNKIYSFTEKRKEAENICRREIKLHNHNLEDCTLQEIYDTFSKIYDIEKAITDKLCQMEEDTDLELITPRSYTKELYDLAKAVGKKRIIITDTYYSKDFIERVLDKIGIADYDGLFISAEKRKLKITGKLFNQAIKELKVEASKILHLGDNWASDHEKAKECGLDSYFIGKTFEIFNNTHFNDNYTGDAFIGSMENVFSFANISKTLSQLPIDASMALIANNMFDKPYPTWNRELRYNANAYFIGLYALGTEMLGLASDIINVCKNNNYKKVIFLARDGYLPKIAFDIVKTYLRIDIDSDYFYTSRRALLPFVVEKENTIGAIQGCINLKQHSPQSIIELFEDYIDNIELIRKELVDKQIELDDNFSNIEVFEAFVNICDSKIDFAKLKNQNLSIKQEIKKVFSSDCLTFDLGYSGRIQSILSDIVEKPLDIYFVHSSGYEAQQVAKKHGFRIFEFMKYTPKITSIVREYFFSELNNSCIGYSLIDGKLIPVFDQKDINSTEVYIFEETVRGMKDFINDYCNTFKNYSFMFEFRNDEISIPFEIFLNQIPIKDIYMYRTCITEDKFYFNYDDGSLPNIWQYELEHQKCIKQIKQQFYAPTQKISDTDEFKKMRRIKRILMLFLFDNKTFREKLKNKIKRKK